MKRNAQQMKIRYFVGLGYLIPIILSVVSAIGTWQQAKLAEMESQELGRSLQIAEFMNQVSFDIQMNSRATRGYMLDPNDVSLSLYTEATAEINEIIQQMKQIIIDTDQLSILRDLEDAFNQQNQMNQNLINLVQQGKVEEAIADWKAQGGRNESQQLTNLLADFDAAEAKINGERQANLKQALTQLIYRVIIFTLASAIVAIGFCWWIIGWISNRLTSTTSSLASSSNEIVTTVEELSISSRQSAEQAQAAALAAQQVLHLAESGRQTASDTIQGMDSLRDKVQAIATEIVRLNEQTGQIGKISLLVSDLANQTNMLALNAAVEAVRAGEHGKGFSVVAAEIRKLADQSRQSAGQISSLVGNIQQAIQTTVTVTDEGTQTVESNTIITKQSADAFAGVTEAINEVVENNQQISLNIQQQASAIQQVLAAMTELNQAAKNLS